MRRVGVFLWAGAALGPCVTLTAAAVLGGCAERPEGAERATDADPTADAAGSADERAAEAERSRAEYLAWLGFEPPTTARIDVAETLWRDARTPRHPADGGGSWRRLPLDDAPPPRAGGPVRVAFEYTAGPAGVAVGGALYLQAPPFWGWSTPQSSSPEGLGYTTVETAAQGVALEPATVDEQLLAIRVVGRPLAEGETVRIVYGAGPARARADRFAEAASRFHLAVDGDGDGVRALLDVAVGVEVGPGPPARLLAHLPATARPGETVALRLALVDGRGNRSALADAPLTVELAWDDGRALGSRTLEPGQDHLRVELDAGPGGTRRLVARLRDAEGLARLEARSNPMRVSDARRVLWADLQAHSALSDGTGEPPELFAYAREVAALDVFALTDHDHWGLAPLDEHPELWERILDAADAADDPGRFLALVGFEWTSWLFGHRHVLFLGTERPLLSSLERATDEPRELWAALRGLDALSIPHTLAGGPVAVDWSTPPDPEVEPVVELVSVHGASDGPDSPRRIYSAVDGHWFGDVLARGYTYGVLGSTDGHDGHPGLAHLAAPNGGLAGILAESATRADVLAALRARRCFATSGPRILVRTNLGGAPMGASLAVAELGEAPALFLEVFGTDALERLELLGADGVLVSLPLEGGPDLRTTLALPPPAPGDRLWLRVVQADGHAAWTSPYCFE